MKKILEKIILAANNAGDSLMHSGIAKRVAAGVLAFAVVLTPVTPSLIVMADDAGQGDEVTETTETTAVQTEATVTEATLPAETTAPDYSDYAEPTPVVAEDDDIVVSDPSDTIDTTAPPTEENEEPVVTTTDATESSVVTTTETTSTSEETTTETTATEATTETSETVNTEATEPSTEETVAEEPVKETIVKVSNAEAYVDAVAEMPDGDKLIVKTSADLASLEPDSGVYYDGTYMLYFADQRAFDAAVDYVEAQGYEYSIDGQVALCGDFTDVITFHNVKPNASGPKIAIIDTGADSGHANERYSVVGDDVNDYNGHGNAMADFLLAEAPDAYIISIKAVSGNKGYVSDIYAAVQYAETLDVDYILLAMSIRDNGDYDAFKTLIQNTKATIVASAGNNGRDASGYLPAGISGVITVGAIDSDNDLRSFSNYGTAVEYYVNCDSTSEAAARALGRIIVGEYVTSVAFVPGDNSMYYMKGSEHYFTLDAAIQSTKTIEVLKPSEMDGWTADEFRHEVLDHCDYYRGTTYANGCIAFVKDMYCKAGNPSWANKFQFRDGSAGCTTSMRSLGYSSPNAIGITDLKNSQDVDVCIASGRAFYNYITTYAKPGDIIMFGYPADSGGLVWHHAAIYWRTNRSEMFGGEYRDGIQVYEVPGNGGKATTRIISPADFHQWGSGIDSKIFTTAVILTPTESSPEAYFYLSKTVGSNQSLVAGQTYNFTLTDDTASVTVATGSCTATASGKANVTWSNVASGYSLEDQNTTVILIPDHQYTVAETTTTVGGRALSVAWTNGTTSLGTGTSQTFTATDGSTYSFNAENSAPIQVSFTKASANPSCTDGNPMYSLAGTSYGVYANQTDAQNKTNALTTINFNASGVADKVFTTDQTKATYYLRELTAGPGYVLDNSVIPVVLTDTDTVVNLTDAPLFDPFFFSFVKRDHESWDMVTELAMAGTQFDFYYYANSDTYGSFSSYTSTHTPTAQGVITMSAFTQDPLSGLYEITVDNIASVIPYFSSYVSVGQFPLGTYIVKERSAPAGYTVTPEEFAWCLAPNGNDVSVIDLTPATNSYTYTAIEGSTVYLNELAAGGLATFRKTATSNNGLEALAPSLYNFDGTTYEIYAKSTDNLMLTITFNGSGNVKNVVYASGITPDAAHKWTSGNEIWLPYTDANKGEYYIVEKHSTGGYYLDTVKHNFTVVATGTTQVTVSDEPMVGKPDTLLKKAVSSTLSDEVLAQLSTAGATFTVTYYNEILTASQVASATPVLEAQFVTDANGIFKFDSNWYTPEFAASMYASYANQLKDANGDFRMPQGTYVIREIKAPVGLTKSDEIVVIPIEFKSDIVKGSANDPEVIGAYKASIHNAGTLTGAVYNETTGQFEFPNGFDSTMSTVAVNTANGTKELVAEAGQSITDTAQLKNLAPGFSYRAKAWINADNGTPNDASDDFTVQFKGSVPSNTGEYFMSTPVTFVSASSYDTTLTIEFADIDASVLEGMTLTVCEEIYLQKSNGDEILYLSHKDIKNKSQQVYVPAIRTTLLDVALDTFNPSADAWGTYTDSTGYQKILSYGTNVSLTDYVSYLALTPGEEYEATATLKYTDGTDVLDGSGNVYTAVQKFTPTTANGVVEVTFTGVDTTQFVSSVVCFEDVKHGGISIASHADLTDKWQTLEKPEIHTTASDIDNGTHTLTLKERVTIADKVDCQGLVEGRSYVAYGTLMDKSTGNIYTDSEGKTYTATQKFTYDSSAGPVILTFTDVLVSFEKTTIVVFEDVYDEEKGVMVASHADLNDTDQTVERPTAHTTATVNGNKAVWLGSTEIRNLTIDDKISYEGLEVGTTYSAHATLYKSSGEQLLNKDGTPVIADVEFIPTERDGYVIVPVTFSTEGINEGDEIVVFELIYDVATESEKTAGTQTDDLLIARHEDLNDKDQTITVHYRPMTGLIDTPYAKYGIVLVVAALGGLVSYKVVKKKNEGASEEA